MSAAPLLRYDCGFKCLARQNAAERVSTHLKRSAEKVIPLRIMRVRDRLGQATNQVIHLLVDLSELGENFLRQLANGSLSARFHVEREEVPFNKVCGESVR